MAQSFNPKCTACALHKHTKNVCLAGIGNAVNPRVMIIVGGLTRSDDVYGRYLSGDSGILFGKILKGMDIVPDRDIYISGLVKCVPYADSTLSKVRFPSDQEIIACSKYLKKELYRIPEDTMILAMGSDVISALLGTNNTKIIDIRGKLHKLEVDFSDLGPEGVKKVFDVIPTYSPKFVLQKGERSNAYIDFRNDVQVALFYSKSRLNYWKNYRLLTTISEVTEYVDECISRLENGDTDFIACDTETSSLNPWSPDEYLLCISLCNRKEEGVVIPLLHEESPFKDELTYKFVVSEIHRLFKSKINRLGKTTPIVGHNFKFDLKWLCEKLGLEVTDFNVVMDTMLAHFFLEGPHWNGLKDLTARYVSRLAGYEDELEDIKDKIIRERKLRKSEFSYSMVPLQELFRYAAADADATYCLALKLYEMLKNTQTLVIGAGRVSCLKVFNEVVMYPYEFVCFLDLNGLRLSRDKWEESKLELESRIKKCVQTFREFYVVEEFFKEIVREEKLLYDEKVARSKNASRLKPFAPSIDINSDSDVLRVINSTKSLSEILYNKMGIEVLVETKKGNPSTNANTLDELAIECYDNGNKIAGKFIDAILDYKKLSKIYTTYIMGVKDLIYYEGGELTKSQTIKHMKKMSEEDADLIHSTFNMTGTVTGRLSSSGPNFQNLPRVDKIGVKKVYTSRYRNGVLIQADYSQIEVRLFASIAGDEDLINVFERGEDFHFMTASKIYRKPIERITKEERTISKAATFLILYGGGAKTLAKNAECSVEEAQEIINSYMIAFPKVKAYMELQKKIAMSEGYVYTPFGRRRHIPEVFSKNEYEREKGFRYAVNTPIQGGASDIALLSTSRLYERIKNLKSLPVVVVHDSVIVDTYPDEIFKVIKAIQFELSKRPKMLWPWLRAPLQVDMEIGKTWGNLVEIKECHPNILILEGKADNLLMLDDQLDRYAKIEALEEKYSADGIKIKAKLTFTGKN